MQFNEFEYHFACRRIITQVLCSEKYNQQTSALKDDFLGILLILNLWETSLICRVTSFIWCWSSVELIDLEADITLSENFQCMKV